MYGRKLSDTGISGTFSGTFYKITNETEFEGTQFPEILTINKTEIP